MAKRKDSEVELLVGGAGVLAAFWTLLVSEVEKLGGTVKDLHRLVTPEGMVIIKGMAALIVGKETEVVSNVAQAVGDMISRVVPVNYNRTPKKAIEATGRAIYADDSVVKTMPACGDGIKDGVEVVFFKLGRYASDDEVAAEFAKRGIEPDSYAVAAVNEADPGFADEHPNCTIWKDTDGHWCFVAFRRFGRERGVFVGRRGFGWRGLWWFGGVRK